MFFSKKYADIFNFLAFCTEKNQCGKHCKRLYLSQEYQELQARKRMWIPLACIGKCSISRAAKEIGITARSVSYLKSRYRTNGDSIFTNGHKGKSYQTKKYSDSTRQNICNIYKQHWQGTNFSTFKDRLAVYHGIKIGIITLTQVLNNDGIISPKWHGPKKEKKKHLPRKERLSAQGNCCNWTLQNMIGL